MRKHFVPLLFILMIFILIPKGAYYKKDDIDIKIATTDGSWNGHLYLKYPLGYEAESAWKKISGKKSIDEKIQNTILDRYIISIKSSVGEIDSLRFVSGQKEIEIKTKKNQKYFDIPWKNIRDIYSISYINIMIYIAFLLSLVRYYFKEGLEASIKNIGILSLTSVLLAISLNMSWLSKTIGIFLSLTLLKVYVDRKKIEIGLFEVLSLLLLVLSLMSEYYNFGNYERTYQYFQNTIMIIICVKIWKFNYEDKEILKKFFKIILIMLALMNMISPLVMGGVYAFTFGIFMTILVSNSVEDMLFNKQTKTSFLLNIFALLSGLYGVFISSRRTMIVALGVYVIYIFIKLLKEKKRKIINILLITTLFMSVLLLASKDQQKKIKEQVVSIINIKTDGSNIQRLLMWRRGPYILKENSMLGIGVDSFYKESIKEKYEGIKDKREKFRPDFIHIHNEYIHQIITRGIFGALLFYSMCVYILSRLRNSEDKNFDMMLLLVYGVYGIFDPYSIRSESIILYLFIGISFINCLPTGKKENKYMKKLGFISIIIMFLISLYFNKRFRYYFFIALILYIGSYLYKKRKREKNEKI